MASKALLVMMIAVLLAAIAAPAMAKEIVVGDDSGWKLDFDYKGWAAGKEFHVGDTLVFKYPHGVHNVIKSNKTEFQACTASYLAEPLTSGNDVITLKAPGKKWYICGVGNHCSRGMKLVIDVLDVSAAPVSAPAPSPISAPDGGWLRFIHKVFNI